MSVSMSQLSLNAMLLQQAVESGSPQKEAQQEKEVLVYAKKGDPNYNKDMDSDLNEVVTYEEYMEYCKQNSQDPGTELETKAVIEKNDSEEFRTINVGKAFETYSQADIQLPEPKFKREV